MKNIKKYSLQNKTKLLIALSIVCFLASLIFLAINLGTSNIPCGYIMLGLLIISIGIFTSALVTQKSNPQKLNSIDANIEIVLNKEKSLFNSDCFFINSLNMQWQLYKNSKLSTAYSFDDIISFSFIANNKIIYESTPNIANSISCGENQTKRKKEEFQFFLSTNDPTNAGHILTCNKERFYQLFKTFELLKLISSNTQAVNSL